MQNGTITLNAVTEKQLAKILEFKVQHEGKFTFDAGAAKQNQSPDPKKETNYNSVILSWPNDESLKVVLELVGSLIAEHH